MWAERSGFFTASVRIDAFLLFLRGHSGKGSGRALISGIHRRVLDSVNVVVRHGSSEKEEARLSVDLNISAGKGEGGDVRKREKRTGLRVQEREKRSIMNALKQKKHGTKGDFFPSCSHAPRTEVFVHHLFCPLCIPEQVSILALLPPSRQCRFTAPASSESNNSRKALAMSEVA